MSTITVTDVTVDHALPGVPYGNLTVLPFSFVTLAGVLTLSDDATAVVHTDKIIMGTIPKGFIVHSVTCGATAALGAATSTIDVGFEYVDGVDVAAYPENIDEWVDAQANTAIFHAIGNACPVPQAFSKDAYLIMTINTAAFETTGGLTGSMIVNLFGIMDQD